MAKVNSFLILILIIALKASCQMKKDLPEFHVEMCYPENKYGIEPVYDSIKTLEGVSASFRKNY